MPADLELTTAERGLRDLMRAWTALFAAGTASFALTPGTTVSSLNLLPGPPLPRHDELFWNALGVSLMATLTVLAAMTAADVRGRRHLVVPLMVSKAVSTGMFASRFRRQRRTPYLAGLACDGSILLVTLQRYIAAR